MAALDCPSPPEYNDCSFLAIFLKKLPTGHRQYARITVGNLLEVYELGQTETIYVRQSIVAPELTGALPHHILQLRDVPHPSTHPTTYRVVNVVVPSARLKPPETVRSLESRKSVPAQWPVTFRMHKASKHLAAFVVFQRDDGKGLLIMLGSEDGFNVGFDALDTSDIGDWDMSGFKAMSNYFTSPKKPGTYLVLDNHLVCVNAEPLIHNGSRYYMIDIEIEGIYKPRNPFNPSQAQFRWPLVHKAMRWTHKTIKMITSPKSLPRSPRRHGDDYRDYSADDCGDE